MFLSDWARESIAYDVGRMEGDFLECGGCLLGRSSGPGRITVEVAGATSDYVGRGSNFIETNLSGYETLARSYADLGLRWLGGWHSHPGETHARASTADRENWAGNRSYHGHDYVGLIAIPREWGEIALRAWVATANGVELASLVD